MIRRTLLPALLFACGCAGITEVNKRSPGAIANGTLTPARPAAVSYGPDPARTCPQFGVNGEVASQLPAPSQGKPAPEAD